jgi:uncharacterized protein involved in exopolysaccharide biosynthesis
MARIEEATLFRADSRLIYPGRPGTGGGGGGGGGGDEDGPRIAVGARVAEAARSATRRKGLSSLMMLICGAVTVLGALFAPRSYEVEARVLVQQTTAIGEPQGFVSAEEMHNRAREYEEQVMARDNIVALVKQTNLVDRWDAMRQPHRRLLDRLDHTLDKPAPSSEAKHDALVANIAQHLKVSVDATTVSVHLEWPEPESAREIVDAAVKNFLAARYQSEVGMIPARLARQKAFVAQAHKELEAAAADLVRLQKPKVVPDVGVSASASATAPRTVQDAQVRFDTVTASYQSLVKRLQELQLQLQEQEAFYKNRYKITHPAEVPVRPKQPVALIAIAIGLLTTLGVVLLSAGVADRLTGMFFEPRDVRDRLGLPVFATFS